LIRDNEGAGEVMGFSTSPFHLPNFPQKKQKPMREKLVKAIIDLSEDELTTIDFEELCYESQEQLIYRLINIANWYAERYNELA
jgi:hypothetical protein